MWVCDMSACVCACGCAVVVVFESVQTTSLELIQAHFIERNVLLWLPSYFTISLSL